MKLSLLILLYFAGISTTDHIAANKYFEGMVTYKITVESGNPKADSALSKIFGTGATLFFKEGNFLHKFDSGLLEMDLYNRKDNKAYFKKNGDDTIYWVDGKDKGDSILSVSFTTKKEKVLGIDCDEMVIHYQDKTVTDYYNADSLGIDGALMKNLLQDGENIIDEKENAIFLKHKTQYARFSVIQTAAKFTRQSIDASVFNIPSNAILRNGD